MKINSILLVEDDDLDVISIERSLKKIGLDDKLHTAFNGIEALAMLKGEGRVPKIDHVPDVILLDLNMPKMNGIEFLTQLRNDVKYKDIKVFIMTTSNESSDRKAAEELGISGYILKPLNFNDNTKNNSSMDQFMHFQMLKIMNQ